MGNNGHSERCVIQEVKRASEQSCVGEIGLQHAFLLSSSGQVFSLVFNVFPNKLFVVGVTGLSRKDRKKYEDWKAQSLGGKVGGKIHLRMYLKSSNLILTIDLNDYNNL